ncbi:hypothetical protein BWQ96_07704 [Gracilariopsis chorda]|uniref:Uncharacterized protein n=1 Tax=Gracilariopsis chorda TaxID=448386 RepID=A0A2V3IKD3_9FLOR|nr:hypothetical protein BWQ96_07704 [Gracilariopsis chorda]|eukprot:PXF42542.1 hypothetical protein BWQ96_07704 [Gracilariopsis chorda]
MKFHTKALGVCAPKDAPVEAKQVADRVVCGEDGEWGSSKPKPLYFQPSTESLSIFDQAKRQCDGGARVGRGLGLGKVLRPGRQMESGRGSGAREDVACPSTKSAASFEPSSESLAIFDKAKQQCDKGDMALRGLRTFGRKKAPSCPFVGNGSKEEAVSVTAAPIDSMLENRSSADTNIQNDRARNSGQSAAGVRGQGSIDAAKWCSLVRQHQASANYLRSNCRKAFLIAQKRSRQPFTPRDRYRSPPRRSVASACWESWCTDEKLLASIRKDVKDARERKREMNMGRRFMGCFASTRRLFERTTSWLSAKIQGLWKGVCRLAKWMVSCKFLYVACSPNKYRW